MQNKRGQFYLVAAVIIVAVLLGFAAVRNVAVTRNTEQSIKLYEISKELQLEGESVINHGIFQSINLNILLDEFVGDYGEYISDKENDIYFIYGNTTSVDIIGYVNVETGSVGLIIGGSDPITINIIGNRVTQEEIKIEDYELNPNVLVNIGNTQYPFEIKKGENFFFIVRQPIGSGDTQIGVSNT